MDNRKDEDFEKKNGVSRPDKKSVGRKRKTGMPDLSILYESDVIDEEESAKFSGLSDAAKETEAGDGRTESDEIEQVKLPSELDYYLPPEILRKIKSGNPGKGTLLNALDRLRSLQYVLSTFLPGHLVQEKMQKPVSGVVKCDTLSGTLLFSDVSGFTALSERLSVLGLEGAEKLTAIMNQYFGTMLEILSWSGGILIKFAGDATLVYFPEQKNGEQVKWAVRAGFRMFRAMKEFENIETPQGNVTLKMKIGIGTGEYVAASVGTKSRMEYVVFGRSVHETMASESVSTGAGQLIVNQSSIPYLDDDFVISEHSEGFYRVEALENALDDFEIKAEKRRGRGMIPLDATPQSIMKEMTAVLLQIEAITPYLAGELIDRLVVQGRKRKIESEFRPTTVLFCNFVGLDALIKQWENPQGMKRICSILSTYFQSMNEAITRFGGIVSRIDPYKDGMKMLVLFGAPVAHEDDTQRAVSASLAMNEKLRSLNAYWQKKYKRYLNEDMISDALMLHRIGITYGGTFAGQVGSSTRCEYTVMGDDVNLAARLMGAADMGQILISKNVYSTVMDYFLVSELPAISVKGKSKPIPIYQVDAPRNDILINRAHRRNFIAGREMELEKASSILEKAFAGSTQELVIQGPAGIGKSHLADFIMSQAIDEGASVFPVQCRPYTAKTSYQCWRAFLKSWAGMVATDTIDMQQKKLSQALCNTDISLHDGSIMAEFLNVNFIPLEGSTQAHQHDEETYINQNTDPTRKLHSGKWRRRGSRLELLDQLQAVDEQTITGEHGARHVYSLREIGMYHHAFASFIRSITLEKPLVIFFEDAHWMDQETREIIDFLNRVLEKNPCLILSARRETDELICDSQNVISLEALDLNGTRDLISYILVSDLAPLVQQQSNGNPLFIEQMILWLKRTRKIEPSDLQSILKSSNVLQELVLSSIETLPEMEQEIIKIASVTGYEFRYSEIQCLLPETIEPATLSAYLRHLVESRLLTLNDASVDTLYGYQQSLVRDVLYDSIPFERRRELHLNLAEYLSQDHSERRMLQDRIQAFYDDEDLQQQGFQEYENIALHYEWAECYLDAARYFLEAGNAARISRALEKAGNYYRNAMKNLGLITGDDTEEQTTVRYHIETGLADIHFLKGDILKASQIYARLLNCHHHLSDTSIIGKQAIMLVLLGRDDEAITLMEENEQRDGRTEDLFLMAIMAWLYWKNHSEDTAKGIESLIAISGISAENKWMAGIDAFMLELKGEWEKAYRQYCILGMNDAAILVAMYAGNQSLLHESGEEASNWFEKAFKLFSEKGFDDTGVAVLVFFHLAKSHYFADQQQTALDHLKNAIELMKQNILKPGCSIIDSVKNLTISIENDQIVEFPSLDWQEIDDSVKASLLFPP